MTDTEDARFIVTADVIIGKGDHVTVPAKDRWRSALLFAIVRRRKGLGVDHTDPYGERARIVVDQALGDG